MYIKNLRRYLISLLLVACVTSSAIAEGSKDYAAKGKRAWAAFECSSLASVAGDEKQQASLFTLGFKEGKVFLKALQAGKIKKEDLNSEVPTIMLLLLEGPSHDFILGRVFENAQEHALKDIYGTDGRPQSEEERKILARNELSRRNCDLIVGK